MEVQQVQEVQLQLKQVLEVQHYQVFLLIQFDQEVQLDQEVLGLHYHHQS